MPKKKKKIAGWDIGLLDAKIVTGSPCIHERVKQTQDKKRKVCRSQPMKYLNNAQDYQEIAELQSGLHGRIILDQTHL